MNSTRLLPRLRRKTSSEEPGAGGRAGKKRFTPTDRNLQFDLFAQLSYMSAMATAGVTRAELFEHASQLPYASSRYFKDVQILARKMNTDYAESCRIVAERAKSPVVRSLLLRMAGSLSAGEDEVEFLRRESEIIGETYGNEYERDVESLKKWTDAYVTLLVASGLIVIVAVISMMIYQVGVAMIVGLSFMMVGATVLGAWIIYASAPREVKTRITGPSSKGQLLGTKLFRIMSPIGVATVSIALLFGLDLGIALILGAAFLFPAGFIISRDDKNISRKDADIPTVVRVLGGFTSALGTTITEALGRVDRRSMGSLMPEVTRLRYRLRAGITPSLCWDTFVDETGSELIDRTVQIFWNSLRLGGDPRQVGTAAAFFSSKIAFLRATRKMVASTFAYLAVPLHIAMVGLLEFIVEIMNLFSVSIGKSSESLGALGDLDLPSGLSATEVLSFGQVDLQMVGLLVTTVVLVLTAANAFAPKAADGGANLKVAYNLSIMMAMTGTLMIIVPMGAQAIFQSIVDV